MGTWQVLPSTMYRGTGLLSTRGGGHDAAVTGLTAAVASHARGGCVGRVAHSTHASTVCLVGNASACWCGTCQELPTATDRATGLVTMRGGGPSAATAASRPAVAASYPPPRVLSSLPPRPVAFVSACQVPAPHSECLRERRCLCGSAHECVTRPRHLSHAREASAAGRPAVAASHPPPRVLSSPVARSVTATLPHQPHQYQ